jgi:hypothetical protein
VSTRLVNRLILALAFAALAAGASGAPAQAAPKATAPKTGGDLSIGPQDVRIEARADGGYDLYVRKKPGIASILLTESTKDPAMKADNFAYRAPDYNAVNGDEKRLLNGKALPPANKLYSLISSTPKPDERFGSAFRVLIPPVLVYGYSWSRSGAVAVGKDTFINIRSFARPYADYSGAFQDNPYQIKVAARPLPPPLPSPPQPEPVPAPIQKPQKESPPPPADDRTSSKLDALIEAAPNESLDLVVCLDTTESMKPYIDDLKANLGSILRKRVSGFASFRIGIVLFKDYWPDDYITRKYPFTSDIAAFEKTLKGVWVEGGKDIPEAEHEALDSAAVEFDWKADRRQVILVTDAPPHPEARGKILFGDVVAAFAERRIEADAIIEPTVINPPNPMPKPFDKVGKRLDLLAASGSKLKILALGTAAGTALPEELLPPGAELLAPPRAIEAAAKDAALLKAATGEAKAAGASHLILASEGGCGALSETIIRLIDAASGKELERDVLWRVRQGGAEALFIDGIRAK